jgi:hypothetical protein
LTVASYTSQVWGRQRKISSTTTILLRTSRKLSKHPSKNRKLIRWDERNLQNKYLKIRCLFPCRCLWRGKKWKLPWVILKAAVAAVCALAGMKMLSETPLYSAVGLVEYFCLKVAICHSD